MLRSVIELSKFTRAYLRKVFWRNQHERPWTVLPVSCHLFSLASTSTPATVKKTAPPNINPIIWANHSPYLSFVFLIHPPSNNTSRKGVSYGFGCTTPTGQIVALMMIAASCFKAMSWQLRGWHREIAALPTRPDTLEHSMYLPPRPNEAR